MKWKAEDLRGVRRRPAEARAGPTHPAGPPRGSRPAGAGAGPPRPAGAPPEGSALPASPAGLEGLGTESQPRTSRCGNLTNPAGGFRARGEVRGPPAAPGAGLGARERSGRRGARRGRGDGALASCGDRGRLAGSESSRSAPRAPGSRVGRGAARARPRACPPPAARLAHPPGAPRAARAAADLPRWHGCRKPARNCKANKAEILGLVSVVTRSALLPPICLCSSI